MKSLELVFDGKKLPFSPDIAVTEDGETIYIGADFGDGDWKQTFFADIPQKELYKQNKALQQIYDQLEDKLTKYTKDTYPDIKVDWDMLVYDKLLLADNDFRMSTMIDK